ncbi:MAG: hypothetical protein AAFV53_16565 [Myxococcota bacterium]
MRGFTQPHTETVTFMRGPETVSYTVHARPLLFDDRVQVQYSHPQDANPDATDGEAHAWALDIGLIYAAEALRPSEEGIPETPADSGPVWAVYAGQLREMFNAAGLTAQQVLEIRKASDRLTKHITDEQLETAGND